MGKDYFLVNKSNKKRSLKVLKNIGLFLLVCLVFGVNCYFDGFSKTAFKILKLFVYCLYGIALFYILYYVGYFISLIAYKSNKKKNTEVVIDYDNLTDLTKSIKYTFSYDREKSLPENAKGLFDVSKSLVFTVASSYGAKGRYKMLNFTVYDAIGLIENVLNSTQAKVENVLDAVPFVNLKEKPISFLENYLAKTLNNVEDENKSKNVILGFVISKAVPLLKNQIDKEANELIGFVLEESFKLYGKKGKKFKLIIDEDVEVVYD